MKKTIIYNDVHICPEQIGQIINDHPQLKELLNYLVDINSTAVDFVNSSKVYYTLGKVAQLRDLLNYSKRSK